MSLLIGFSLSSLAWTWSGSDELLSLALPVNAGVPVRTPAQSVALPHGRPALKSIGGFWRVSSGTLSPSPLSRLSPQTAANP